MHRSASPRPGYRPSSRSGSLANTTPLSPRLGIKADRSRDASPALNFLARRGSEAHRPSDDETDFDSHDPFVVVDADEAMANAERDLKADAEWKRIQQNTFTRWANEHLKQAEKQINNLETELSDGLKLISLIEVLSGKRMPRHNKKPTFRSQKLENVSIALQFLEREGITLVNIDSTDIVDCKLKLILGLIWTLILHYAISMPMWDGPTLGGGGEEKTPKQRLLGWVKDKMPDLPVNNFTTDWNSGKAVGALVDSVAPGLCPDWEDWDPSHPLENAREAMDLADQWLNVPKLLTPEDIVNPNLDEQSMMTYLSQFPNAKLKPGAPLRQKTNPSKVRAYGPGLEPKGLVAKAPAKFTVETFGAGDGEVIVEVTGPNGNQVKCDVVFNNDRRQTYSCSYYPEEEGDYVVTIKFATRQIPKSPYHVTVEGFAGDASKVTASGPGLEPEGVIINRPTYFDIYCEGAGKGNAEVIILDPKGKKDSAPVKVSPHPVQQDVYRCEYIATMLGMHSINVFYAGNPIPDSPYGVKVAPVSQPNKVWANGRGLQPNGIRVNETVDFKVYTEGAGEGVVGVKIIGPGGKDVHATSRKLDSHITEYTYTPQVEGRHIIMITFANQEIPRSPFEVKIGPYKTSKIKAYGPGLKGGIVNKPAVFTVDTCGETGSLGFSIQGPSQAKINCKDNSDGSADIEYLPTEVGEYAIHVLCDKEDIPGSPFMAQIIPGGDFFPDKVKVFGPGIENGVNPKEKTYFTIDTTEAGQAPLEVLIIDALGQFEPEIKKKSEGIFECTYTTRKGMHKQTIMVNFGGVAVPGSPFHVTNNNPNDPSKVEVYGPGVEKGVQVGVPVDFTVDCKKSGPGDVRVKIESSKRKSIPVSITDNGDDTYKVNYEAQDQGPQTITITLDDEEIPQSPIKLDIKKQIDLSKIKIIDLDNRAFVDCVNDFYIDLSGLPLPDQKSTLNVTIQGPNGKPLDTFLNRPTADGPYQVSYTPTEEGEHEIDIQYSGLPLPDTPFPVIAERGFDPSKVKASGDGLEKGFVDETNSFDISTKNAGAGELGISVEGPEEAEITCLNNNDGTCSVNYVPTEEGDYDVCVKFGDEHIPGSPFKVPVTTRDGKPKADARKVTAYGTGLEPENVFPGKPAVFTIDSTATGEAPIEVEVTANGRSVGKKPILTKKGIGLHDVTYVPPPVGNPYDIGVKYGGIDIPGSPFPMTVNPDLESPEDDSYYRNGTGLQRKKPSDASLDKSKSPTGNEGSPGEASRRGSNMDDGSRKGSLQQHPHGQTKRPGKDNQDPNGNDGEDSDESNGNDSKRRGSGAQGSSTPGQGGSGREKGPFGADRKGSKTFGSSDDDDDDNDKSGRDGKGSNGSKKGSLGSHGPGSKSGLGEEDSSGSRRSQGRNGSGDSEGDESDPRGSSKLSRDENHPNRSGNGGKERSSTGSDDSGSEEGGPSSRRGSNMDGSRPGRDGKNSLGDGNGPNRRAGDPSRYGDEDDSDKDSSGKNRSGKKTSRDGQGHGADNDDCNRKGSKLGRDRGNKNGSNSDEDDVTGSDRGNKRPSQAGDYPYGEADGPHGSRKDNSHSLDGKGPRGLNRDGNEPHGMNRRGSGPLGHGKNGSDPLGHNLDRSDNLSGRQGNLGDDSGKGRFGADDESSYKPGKRGDDRDGLRGTGRSPTDSYGSGRGDSDNDGPYSSGKHGLGNDSPHRAGRDGPGNDTARRGDDRDGPNGSGRHGSDRDGPNGPGRHGLSDDSSYPTGKDRLRGDGLYGPGRRESDIHGPNGSGKSGLGNESPYPTGRDGPGSDGLHGSGRHGPGDDSLYPAGRDGFRGDRPYGSGRRESDSDDGSNGLGKRGPGRHGDDRDGLGGSGGKSPDGRGHDGSGRHGDDGNGPHGSGRRGHEPGIGSGYGTGNDGKGRHGSVSDSPYGSGRDGSFGPGRGKPGDIDSPSRRGSHGFGNSGEGNSPFRSGRDNTDPSSSERGGRGPGSIDSSNDGRRPLGSGLDGQSPYQEKFSNSGADGDGYPGKGHHSPHNRSKDGNKSGSRKNSNDYDDEAESRKPSYGRRGSDSRDNENVSGPHKKGPLFGTLGDNDGRKSSKNLGRKGSQDGLGSQGSPYNRADSMAHRGSGHPNRGSGDNDSSGNSSDDNDYTKRGKGKPGHRLSSSDKGSRNDDKLRKGPSLDKGSLNDDIYGRGPDGKKKLFKRGSSSSLLHPTSPGIGEDKYGRARDDDRDSHGPLFRPSEERILHGKDPYGKQGGRESNGNNLFAPLELNGIPLPPGAKGGLGDRVEAKIKTPSGYTDVPEVTDSGKGSIGILYQPTEAGPHTLNINYEGESVQGSPFQFYATPLDGESVVAYGPGLTHGVCGDPSKFVISTEGAGAGGLGLAVEGPSKAEINCQDNKDGTVDVSFVPTAPGEYKIAAKFAGKHIEGSPFTCKVTGEGTKKKVISVGSGADMSLPEDLSNYDLRTLQASIISPTGIEEPCFLKKLPNGGNGVSFTPRKAGEHLVSVKRNGQDIQKSPFKIFIKEDEVGNASKVKATGPGLSQGKTQQDNIFNVDTKNAGYGGLSLSIEGPSKAKMNCRDNEDGTLDVMYNPTEPGIYLINLKYADEFIPGSPFAVPVSGEGLQKQTGKANHMREAVPITEVGSQCRLTFKMPGINSVDLTATVSSPSGKIEKAVTAQVEDGLYSVNFVPYELGIHTVVVNYKDIDIPGSPFQFTVGPLQDGGAHRVHAGGPGLERGIQGQPCDFDVWTREAGKGSMSIHVEGPGKAEVDIQDRKDGSCHVSYIVDEPGEYSIGVRFNDTLIPDSPSKVCILPSAEKADRVRISNITDLPVAQDVPQTMLLNMNGADGDVECIVIAPSGHVDDCFITPLGDGEHSVRFIPKEEGIHYLHAKLNGVHIPGSPVKLLVEPLQSGQANDDPSTVTVTGVGIEAGTTGKSSSFVIDTSGVGVGTLSITVDGPSKVDLSCNEVDEGYEVHYTPLVPGKYFVTVKYNGKNVKGSPFSVNIGGENLSSKGLIGTRNALQSEEEQRSSSMTMTMERTSYTRHQYSEQRASSISVSRSSTRPIATLNSDASRVSCQGSGLEYAEVNRTNTFYVDSSKAGHNCLFVGVLGPEIPCEEILIKHRGSHRYSVEYVVKEKGNYVIIVKWGDEHVSGSPFHIKA